MKKIVILLFVVSLFPEVSMFAKGAKRIGYRKDIFQNNTWKGADSSRNMYNADTLQTLLQNLKPNSNNGWDDEFKYTYVYTNTKKISTQIRENWNGTAWVNFDKYTYTYDASDNVILTLRTVWNGSTWVNSNKIDHSNYIATDKPQLEILSVYANNAWQNQARYIYGYQPITQFLEFKEIYDWNATLGWVKYERQFSQYYTNGTLQILTILTPDSNNQWASLTKYIHNYNLSPFRITESVKQFYNYDTSVLNWENERRTQYQYNTNNLLINSNLDLYDTAANAWNPETRTINLYNTSNLLTESSSELYSSGFWSNTSKYTHQYIGNNINEKLIYTGSGSSWTLSKKINYDYNLNDDTTFKQEEIYNGTSFEPNFREYFYYYAGPQSIQNHIKELEQVLIFPNPCQDEINLLLNASESFYASVHIYDLQGCELATSQQLIRKGNQQLKLPTNHLPSGNYLVKLLNEKSNSQQSLQFVKVK